MDPSGLPPRPRDPSMMEGQDENQGNNRDEGNGPPPGWPLNLPAREDLDFLELALTTDVPRPSYDGPIRRPAISDGGHFIGKSFTLPVESPLHVARPALLLADGEKGLGPHSGDSDTFCASSPTSPAPGAETVEPTYLTKVPAIDLRDAETCESQVHDTLQKTKNAHSPPRGNFSLPKVRGMPQEPSPRQDRSLGAFRPTSRSLDGADPGPPDVVRPQRIVTIRSHAAARRWQELELEPILEQRMASLELQPPLGRRRG